MADKYEKLGKGVDAYAEGNYIYLRLTTKNKGEMSSSGKMTLNVNSGGYKEIDETGFFVSVMGGTKTKAKAKE